MRGRRRRSTWTSPIDVRRAQTPRPHRRRLIPWTIVGALVAGTVGAGVLVGLEARPALALCAGAEGGCVDTAPAAGSFVAVLPLAKAGDASLTLSNTDSTDRAEVGVLGYLTEEQPAVGSIVRAGTDTDAVVTVAKGERRAVALEGAPTNARAVLVRVAAAGAAQQEGDHARVTFSSRVAGTSRSQVAEALRTWTAQTEGSMPNADTISRIAEKVTAGLPAPAHLTAQVTAESDALKVDWTLDAGTEKVSAVRIVRVGEAADGSKTGQVDRPVDGDGTVLRGLLADTAYTVSVSPVIDGEAGASVVLAATTPAAPKPTASATASPSATEQPVQPSASAAPPTAPAPTSPATDSPSSGSSGGGSGEVAATPAGWEPIFEQTFDKDAAVGSFGSAYPGYSGYNGGTDTSRTAGRASDKTGLWNNQTTSSVHDGLYDCRLHTEGGRPQVCALTPSQSGQTYGRYTVRFKTDPTPGYKIAYLLWPDTDRWSDGEIDFPEGSLDGTISGSVHDSQGNPSRNAYWVDTKKRMNTWQTATIEWTPGRVSFVLDGESWTTTDPSGMPRGSMHWALQAETEIQAQAPDPSTQGHIYIDWLAGYRYTKG